MKNRLITAILCLGLLTTYFACEKDDTIIKEEQTVDSYDSQLIPIIKTVSFSDVGDKFNRLKNQYNLDGFLHSNLESNTLSKSIDTLGVTIYTDDIKEITIDDYTSYTMRIALPDTDSTKFYNLTIEDKNGVEGMFMTKYTPTQNWLNNKNQAFEGNITTHRTDNITHEFPPDGGGEIDTGNSNPSEEYPEDCDGTVIPTTIMEEYPCGCGHSYYEWEIGECSGSSCGDPFLPGHKYVTTYECWEYGDSDPNTGGDTNVGGPGGPGGNTDGGDEGGEDDPSLTIILGPDECNLSPEDAEYDLNNDCGFDAYEICLRDGYGESLCLEFSEILDEIPYARFDRFIELKERLEENPWALVQDCAEQNGLDTSHYIELYEQPFPAECWSRLFGFTDEYYHQPITYGNVPLANIDYYSVEVTTIPDFNNDGNPDSEAEMYQAFRNNFMDLASGGVEDFQLSCDSNLDFVVDENDTADMSWYFIPLTVQDGIDFVSDNPITSILNIEASASGLGSLAADEGAVMVVDYNNNDWTVATIITPHNGTQPFSGNRQWGWLMNQNGNFEFFTRAVDVANISILLNLISPADTECQQDSYYNIAEATWQNMQQEIAQWVNDNGGQAIVIPHTAVRVDKEKIEELLTSNESIDEILSNCN